MKKNTKGMFFILILVVVSWLSACATIGEGLEECPLPTSATVVSGGAGLPIIELPIPGSEAEKRYLGLTGSGNFKIGQIKARVLIVEVFSFYCPHCQRTAAQINDLYRMIEQRADLQGKVKLIGIGAKNSAFEVDSYRERYQVPFPLFSDEGMELTETLGVKGTPTFIGFKVDGKGFQERFYVGEGGFPDNQKFLAEIVRSSGL